jgi:signal transduction histidine kinase
MGSLSPELLSRIEPLSRGALAHLHLSELCAELPPRVRDLFDVDTVALLLTGDSHALAMCAAHGLAMDSTPISVGAGFAGRIAAERTPIVLDEVDPAELVSPALRDSRVRALMGVPILQGDRLLGVIHIGTREPRRFTAADLELLELVAEHVALAIDRARLYEAEHAARLDAERAVQRAGAIADHRAAEHAVARVVAGTPDVAGALAEVLRISAADLDWDLCQLWTIDPNVEVLRWKDVAARLEACREFVAASQTVRFAPGDGLAGRVWQRGAAEWVNDVPSILWDPRAPAAARAGLRSGVALPARASGRTFGLVEYFTTADRAPDAEVLSTLDTIAGHIGQLLSLAQLAAERDRLLAEATEAGRARDELVAMLSHELRTPVNAMVGWLQMIRSGQLDPARQARALETVERNARAQAQLVEDLIDLTRMARGKLRLTVARCMPAETVHAALDTVQPAATSQQVRLERHIDATAGPVNADPDRLQQIVWNLAVNAIKYTPAGGIVRVHLDCTATHVRLVVADTGRGITPEFLPHVFEPFRQADALNRPAGGGIGLGLAIVKQLVTLHGGMVHASSDGEGLGATFTVTLPLAPGDTV